MREAISMNKSHAVIKNRKVSGGSVGVQENNLQHGVVIKNCRVINNTSGYWWTNAVVIKKCKIIFKAIVEMVVSNRGESN